MKYALWALYCAVVAFCLLSLKPILMIAGCLLLAAGVGAVVEHERRMYRDMWAEDDEHSRGL